jgi:hypothetical protein
LMRWLRWRRRSQRESVSSKRLSVIGSAPSRYPSIWYVDRRLLRSKGISAGTDAAGCNGPSAAVASISAAAPFAAWQAFASRSGLGGGIRYNKARVVRTRINGAAAAVNIFDLPISASRCAKSKACCGAD